ncbi:tetratricopeptide repeat protein [Abyssibacter profundi]|uniref:tetratricopeptide repeat protein n=1 Tax=Abyssibacter profundi TaxID=2182787 RepID=UPI001057B90E|nr:sel1 repeat family protein [Abyssibacter profundi]
MRHLVTLLLLCTPLVTQAVLLPDLERGIRALEAGEVERAEANLRPLAKAGYVEAQHYLARLYKQANTPKSRLEAIRWYEASVSAYPLDIEPLARLRFLETGDPQHLLNAEQALVRLKKQGHPDALRRIIRLYRDFPGLVDDARIGRLLGEALETDDPDNIATVIDWYRKNDGVRENFIQLIQLCSRHYRRVDDCLPDLVLNARMGQNDERMDALIDQALSRYPSRDVDADLLYAMASALLTNDVPQPPEQLRAAELLEIAAKRRVKALARLGDLLVDRPDLIEDADPIGMLERAHEAGSAEAALTLGRAYMNGTLVEIDPDRAEDYLKQAAEALPAGKFSLARYYMRGFAGDAQYTRAAPLLLDAARAGYRRADLDLARFYSENRVVKANPAYAYAFARIAETNEVDGAEAFIAQLQPQLDDAMRAEGNAVAEKEYDARVQRREPFLKFAMTGGRDSGTETGSASATTASH